MVKKRELYYKTRIVYLSVLFLILVFLLGIVLFSYNLRQKEIFLSPLEPLNCTQGCQPAQGEKIALNNVNYSFFANSFNLTSHFRNGSYVYDVDGFNLNLNNGSDLFISPVMKVGDVWVNETLGGIFVKLDAYALIDTVYRVNITFDILSNLPPAGIICGDGIVASDGSEECDDGNLLNMDGCNQSCDIEPLICNASFSWNLTSCVEDRMINYTSMVFNITQGCTISNITLPANQTIRKDCDDNRLLGVLSEVFTENINVNITIGGAYLNLSKKYQGDREIEILDSNKDGIVIFRHDFYDSLFDLSAIKIIRSTDSDKFGYLIIEGLESVDKEIRVRKMNSSSQGVCVKDRRGLSSSSDVSKDCGRSNEYLVKCDGNRHDGFSCEEESTGNRKYYLVEGLRNSGVREMLPGNVAYDSGSTPPSIRNTGVINQGNVGTGNNSNNLGSTRNIGSAGSRDIIEDDEDFEDEEVEDGKGIIFWTIVIGLVVGILIIGSLIIYFIVKKDKEDNETYKGNVLVNRGNQGMMFGQGNQNRGQGF